MKKKNSLKFSLKRQDWKPEALKVAAGSWTEGRADSQNFVILIPSLLIACCLASGKLLNLRVSIYLIPGLCYLDYVGKHREEY